jgi:deoxyhypusine synthase
MNNDFAREAVLQPSNEMPEGSTTVTGFSDFTEKTDYSALMASFYSTGFQATNMALAIEYIKEMLETNSKIYLGYTSNMVSSGMRETFCYLAKNRMIDVIVTSAGGFEEGKLYILRCKI